MLWPVAATAFAVGLAWRLFGVHVHDGVLFGLYLAGFVVLPGCALYAALVRPAQFGVRELGIGWGLGYALEVLVFGATAWLGARGLFTWYPVLVLVLTAPAWWPLLRGLRRPQPVAPSWTWGLALVAIVTVAYTVEGFFTATPLPWEIASVSYHQDTVWNIAMAAEALHHFPLQVPSLAGIPLRYHWFADADAAAVSQVTGLPLSLVMLRLALVPMLLLVVIQFVGLAQALRASAWAGVAGAGLLLLASFADPLPTLPSQMLTTFFFSPSFLYGMVVFLPLVTIVCERMAGGRDGRPRQWGIALVVALLMAACAGGKTTILPVLAGGCVLCLALWIPRRLRRADHAPRVLLATLAGAIAVSAIFALTMYHGGSNTLKLSVLGTFAGEHPFDLLHDRLGTSDADRALIDPPAALLGVLKLLLVSLPGIAVLFARRLVDGPRALLLGMLLAGIAPILVFIHPGGSQFYFFNYAYAAAAALSGIGLAALLGPALGRVAWRPKWVVAAIVAVALVAAVESPVDESPRKTWQALDGQITYSQVNDNLTRPLYQGLRWVAGNTPPSAVIAVNNRFQDPGRGDAHYCYFTAFAERRAMIECAYDGTSSIYGALGDDLSRLTVNGQIFGSADRAALRTAVTQYGVRYLLVDRVHGPVDERVLELGRVVFSNEALTVVAV